ncbi:hypothetical protein GCM10018980_74210 [Streptomyces capoamus]|uniref:Uncharacterized protein n=1 Tax=Streptomyces capoamus TaxID=68183 RepID=A0A919F3G2_9ACTN|nr:hypothetical protein GCM10010501_75650 [Streptomyces libani subsp. rufus]GHG76346.1 hypothetical protein GCM10018980_74210 [Streptomyces capoamus]
MAVGVRIGVGDRPGPRGGVGSELPADVVDDGPLGAVERDEGLIGGVTPPAFHRAAGPIEMTSKSCPAMALPAAWHDRRVTSELGRQGRMKYVLFAAHKGVRSPRTRLRTPSTGTVSPGRPHQ